MMKVISLMCLFAVIVSSVLAAPQFDRNNPDEVKLVRYVNDNNGLDGYQFT